MRDMTDNEIIKALECCSIDNLVKEMTEVNENDRA